MKQSKCSISMNNEIEDNEVKARIERIHDNKHNMIPIVKLVVYQPIDFLLKHESDSLTSDVPDDIRKALSNIKRKAEGVMKDLETIGKVTSENVHVQLEQLQQQIFGLTKATIPEIKEIVGFYSKILQKDYFFSPTSNGEKAKKLLLLARDNCDVACNGLETLDIEEKEASYIRCNLFQIIERVFDGDAAGYLRADVTYGESDRNKDYCVKLDIGTFSLAVLTNIKRNIEIHAFPIAKYEGVMIWEKKVEVSIVEDDESVRISIANNGEPFKGDVSKVFDYGYCYGPTRHTGYGLDSAKKYMDSIEGNIELIPTSDSEYKVTYLITLKKESYV